MRQLGARLGIAIVIALVATAATLGAPADARTHHHHRRHHPAGGGGSPAPAAPSSICTASPSTALLNLSGNVVLSVSCHGLSFAEPITVDSLLVRGNCGATNLPLAATADNGGNASFNIFGFGCLPGTYNVQLVGPITTTEFPVSMSF